MSGGNDGTRMEQSESESHGLPPSRVGSYQQGWDKEGHLGPRGSSDRKKQGRPWREGRSQPVEGAGSVF